MGQKSYLSKLYLYITGTFLAGVLLASHFTFAQTGPATLNVNGGLFNPSGTAITSGNVDFRIEVRDAAGGCVLYTEEHQAQDLSATKGSFSLIIGTGNPKTNNLEGGSNFTPRLFQNTGATGAFTGCPGGVTLATGTERVIRIFYDLGGGYVAMTPDVPITSTAFAMVADTLQGKTPTDFILTNVNTQLSQNSMEYLFTNTNYASLKALVDGTSTQYVAATPLGDVNLNSNRLVNVADPSAPQDASTKNYADTSLGGQPLDMTGVSPGVGGGNVLKWDDIQNKWIAAPVGGVASITAGSGLLGGTIISSGTLSVDVGVTANKILQLNGSAQIPAVDGSLLTNVNAFQLRGLDISGVAPADGQVMTWNSTSAQWQAVTPSGGTITALTGDVTASGSGSVVATIANDAVTSAKINSTGIAKNLLLITDSTTGVGVGYMSCSLGQVLQWDANGWGCVDMSVAMGTSGVTAGTYGSDTMVSRVTVDAQGRVTALSNVNIAFPVTSVEGRTGAVDLIASDIDGLGSAALVNVGTGSSNVPQLDAFGRMPAVDGSQLTNLTAGSVSGVATGTGLVGGTITTYGTLSVDVGTTAGKIMQLTGGAQIPAVDGNLVTNVNAVKLQARDISATAPGGGQVLGWNAVTSMWEPSSVTSGTVTQVSSGTGLLGGTISSTGTLSVDVGTTANKIVQLDGAAQLPAVDGSQLTNLNATRIGTRTIATTAPGVGQYIGWNNTTAQWEPMATTTGTVTSVATGTGLVGGPISSTGTLSVDVGTNANQIMQLTTGAQIPAVDGNLVTNVNAVKLQARDVSATAPATGQVLGWNGSSGVWEPMSTAVGSVTSVTTGTGLLGGAITSSGTLSVDVGTNANQIMQLTTGAQIPAVDGNLVTNINAVKLQARNVAATAPGGGQVLGWNATTSEWEPLSVTSGTVTQISSGTGLTGGPISANGTLSVDVGTTANKIVQLDGAAQLPAVDGSQLTNLNATRIGTRTIATTAPGVGEFIGWNNSTSQWEPMTTTTGTVTNVATGTGLTGGPISSTGTLSVDVGTTANKIVQLTADAQIPAVDGNLVTNINAVKLQTRDVSATAPTTGQVLGWNGSNGTWEPMSTAVGSVTNVATGTGLLGGSITSSGTLSVDVGTTANKIVQLDGAAQLPAVDGSQLTNLNATRIGTRTIATTAPGVGEFIGWNNSTSQWEPMATTTGTVTNVTTGTGLTGGPISSTGTLSVDVGTTANKIMQLTAGAQIPAVDGNLVTNINAVKLQARDVASTAPTSGQVLGWNAGTSVWEPSNVAGGTVTQVAAGTGLTGGPISSTGTLSVDVGTTANKILQLTADAQVPAVDGFLITNVNAFRNGGNFVGANATLGTNDNFNLSLKTNNEDRVTINSSGLVGIGTSAPQAILDVATTTSGNSAIIVPRDTSANRPSAPVNGMIRYNSSLSKFEAFQNGSWANMISSESFSDGLSGAVQYSDGSGSFVANNNVRIDGTNGRLGIGVASPSYKLHLKASGNNEDTLVMEHYDNPNHYTALSGGAYDKNVGAVTSNASIYGMLDNSLTFQLGYNPNPGDTGLKFQYGTRSGNVNDSTYPARMGFYTRGVNIPTLAMTNDNRVGIGTFSPQAVLDITTTASGSSAIILPRDTTANRPPTGVNGMIRYNTSSSAFEGFANGTWGALAPTAAGSSGNSGALQFSDGSGGFISNNNIVVDASNGRVGVGIATPNSKFHVNSSSGGTLLELTDTSTGTSKMDFNVADNSIELGTSGHFYTKLEFESQKMTVTDSGGGGNKIFETTMGKIHTNEVRSGEGIANLAYAPLKLYSTHYPASTSTAALNFAVFGDSGSEVSRMKMFNGDSGNIIMNTTGGNVGIGTSMPQAILDVAATASGNSAVIIPRDTTANRPATGVNGMIRYNTNTNAIEAYTNGSWANLATGGGSQWNSGASSSLNYLAGNVGIGTATPTSPLHVAKAGGTGVTAAFVGTGDYSSVRIGNTNRGFPSAYMEFTGGDEATSSYDGTFIRTVGFTGPLSIDSANGVIQPYDPIITNSAVGDSASYFPKMEIGHGAYTKGASNGYGLTVFANDINQDLIVVDTGSASHQRPLLQIKEGGNSRLFVDKSGGNVGIGTSAPQAILDVVSTTSGRSAIIIPRDTTANRPATGVNGMIRYNTNTNKLEAYENSGWTNMIASGVSSSGNSGALQSSDGSGGFLSNNNIVIDQTNGRIGVGTAAPGRTLDVVGGARVGTGEYSTPYQLSVQSTGNSSWIEVLNNGGAGKGGFFGMTHDDFELWNYQGGSMMFYTGTSASAGTERMRIDPQGRIGIGTPSPTELLSVQGSAAGGRVKMYVSNTHGTSKSAGVALSSNSVAKVWELGTDYNANGGDDFYIWGGGSGDGRFVINSSGNVGVGTLNPTARLSVYNGGASGDQSPTISSYGYYTGNLSAGSGVIPNSYQTTIDDAALGSNWVYGNFYQTMMSGTTATTGGVYAFYSRPYMHGSGSVGQFYGFTVDPYFWGASASGSINDYIGLNLSGGAYGGGATGSITYNTQLAVRNSNIPSANKYGIWIDNITGATNDNYALYSSGGTSYFAGNVGIGTNTPSHKLDVLGNINASNYYVNGVLFDLSQYNGAVGPGGGIAHSITQTATDAATGPRSTLALKNNGTGGLNEYNLIGLNAAGDPTTFIRQNGDSYFAGSVGIGTSIPSAILDVATTVSGLSAIIVPRDTTANRPATGVNGMIRYNTNTNKFEAYENAAWTNVVGAGGSAGNSGTLQSSNGSGGFLSNNNIVIDHTNGRIGIGTTSPIDKLVIFTTSDAGDILIGNQFQSGYNSIYLNGLTGGTNYNFASSKIDPTLYINRPLGKDIVFQEGNNTDGLYLKAGGKVGIGTTTPNSLLHLGAGSNTVAPLRFSGGASLLSTPQPGAVESDGDTLYFTDSTGVRRTLTSSVQGVGQGYHSGITYTTSDAGSPYGGCDNPTEASMNNNNTADNDTWGSASNSQPWIQADLGSTKSVYGIAVGGVGAFGCWGARADAYWALTPSNIVIEHSVNGSAWTQALTGADFTYYNSKIANISFAAPVSARYVRIRRTNAEWLTLGNFRIMSGAVIESNWVSNGDNIYYNYGSVGIGTASPVYPLQIGTSVAIGDGLINLAGSNPTILFSRDSQGGLGDDNIRMSMNGNGAISTFIYGTKKMMIGTAGLEVSDALLVGGNVGIGTSSPAAKKLHVYGPGDYQGQIIADAPTGQYSAFGLYTAGAVKWSFYNHPGAADNIYLANSSGNDVATFTQAGKFALGGSYPNYNISLSGNSVQNVGMNRHTTADTAGNDLNIFAGGATTGATNKAGGNLLFFSGESTGTGTSDISFLTSTAGSSGTATNAGTTKLTIKGSGNVGVGTAAPQALLDLSTTTSGQSAVIVPRDTTANRPPTGVNGMIRFNTTSQKFEAYQGAWQDLISGGGGGGGSSSGNANALQMSNGSGGFISNNNTVLDTSSGYLGLGTAAPSEKLDVVGGNIQTDNYLKVKSWPGYGTGYFSIWHDGDGGSGSGAGTSRAFLGVNGSTVLNMDNNGNVGIGTTPGTTSYKLDVYNTGTATTGNALIGANIYAYSAPAGAGDRNTYGSYHTAYVDGSGAQTGWVTGLRADSYYGGTSTADTVHGSKSTAINYAAGTVNSAVGSYNFTRNSSTGTITDATGVVAFAENSVAGGTIGSATGLWTGVYNSGGTINNAYGLIIDEVDGTNKWSIYATDSSAPSYFAGRIGVGIDAPAAMVDVRDTTTAANGANKGGYFSFGSNPSVASSEETIGMHAISSFQGAAVTNTAWTTGVRGDAFYSGTGTTNQVIAGKFQTNNSAAGTVGTLSGVYTHASNSSTGTTTLATGVTSYIFNSGAGTITSARGLTTGVFRSAGTVSNGVGLYIDTIEATSKFSLYASDATAPSYFAGNVGIGTTSAGQKLTVAGTIESTSGGIKFPDGSTQTSAANPKPPLRFTRTGVDDTESDANKDAQCVSEMGSNYQAATVQDVGALRSGTQTSGGGFVVAGGSWVYMVSYNSGSYNLGIFTSGSFPVACVYKGAILRFTRTGVDDTESDANKDAQCVSEMGSSYQAATLQDVGALRSGTQTSGGGFVVAGGSWVYMVSYNSGSYDLGIVTSGSFPVACVHK